MCECDEKRKQSTEEMLAVRYANLGDGSWLKNWLEQLNERVGWLKRNFSGNGIVQIPIGGGHLGNPEWFMKPREQHPKNKERKPL